MLVIGKPAEFGSDNSPVRGQCQPHTKGWRLRLFHRGQEEVIHTDTYYNCRRIQQECANLPPEAVAARAREIAAGLAADIQDTTLFTGETLDETQKVPGPVKSPGRPAESTEVLPREEMDRLARKRAPGRGE